jgi:hypothetical protein
MELLRPHVLRALLDAAAERAGAFPEPQTERSSRVLHRA